MQTVTSNTKPIPQKYGTVTPYLIVDGVPKLIEFLKHTFDAEERERINDREDHVGHAEVRIGGSIIMMADSTAQYNPPDVAGWVFHRCGSVSIKLGRWLLFGDATCF